MQRATASLCCILTLLLAACSSGEDLPEWTAEQRAVLKSLWIDSLPDPPPAPGNPVADDPRAVDLGHQLFFDPRFSRNGKVSCASCHQPALNFKDGLPKARAIGETRRKTMTIVGAAYSPWLFWDGRRDSLWAQALVPLENPVEHGGTRMQYALLIADDVQYREAYETLFGPLPDLSDTTRFPPNAGPTGNPAEQAAWRAMAAADQRAVSVIFANIGRALAAYERRIAPGAAPFDDYVQALLESDAASAAKALMPNQEAGLRLFIGKAQCIHCHNGPLLTNNSFSNTGLFPPLRLPEDRGRVEGVKKVLADEFNCLGPFSPADEDECTELRFVKQHGVELVAAFRTATLRNTATTGPFMHTGEFETLREVLEHYNEARPTLISDELEPLHLTETELRQLESFLHSLVGPLAAPPELLRAPQAPDATVEVFP